MTKLSETILPNGLVTPDNTATLTNKTISGLNNTITDVGFSYVGEALSSTAPNDGINSVALSAVAPTNNADFALITKGNGALLRDTPDNTATGGNKRGFYGVDLQSSRASSSQVASGSYATISGGINNTASGSYSFATGGNNTATNTYAVALGYNNTASGYNATGIGNNNTASGQYAFAAGRDNISSNSYTVALGYNHEVSGPGSIAMGYENRVDSSYSAVVGGNNVLFSGNYNFVSGQSNITSGNAYGATLGYSIINYGFAAVLLGYDHTTTTSADYAFAAGQSHTLQAINTAAVGRGHFIAGNYGFAAGQSNNITSTGDWGTAFGNTNNVDAPYATVMGVYGESRSRTASFTVSSAPANNVSYPCQTVFMSMGIETSDDAAYLPLQVTTTGIYKYIFMASSTGATFKILVFANDNGNATSKGWEITGVVRRVGTANPTFVGTPTITVIAEDAGASAWDVVLESSTDGNWYPKVKGATASTVKWSASVWLAEV